MPSENPTFVDTTIFDSAQQYFFFYIVANHFTKFVDPADTSIFCSKIVSGFIFCIRFTQVNRQGAIHVRLTRWELKTKIQAAYLTVVECKRT